MCPKLIVSARFIQPTSTPCHAGRAPLTPHILSVKTFCEKLLGLESFTRIANTVRGKRGSSFDSLYETTTENKNYRR